MCGWKTFAGHSCSQVDAYVRFLPTSSTATSSARRLHIAVVRGNSCAGIC